MNQIKNQSKVISYPYPKLSESLNICNQNSTCNESNDIYSNSNRSCIYYSSPNTYYSNSISSNENSTNYSQNTQYISNTTTPPPPIQSYPTHYYLPENEVSLNQYNQSIAPVTYYQEIPQSQIIYC
eukprot:jgi/Orpsp1_1/1186298/evm.model.d7180000049514.1